ncbi:MAG: hypothetical protein JWM80_185 [Cyanobacteria bacterium RYN_339]|nr:hypothetical protein [Cyanobacteria bacterium RYN_339]
MKFLWSIPIAVLVALPALALDDGEKLIGAAYQGDVTQARELIEAGAPVMAVDVHGDTPLHWAAREGRLPVAVLLLQRGAAIDAENKAGETPLMGATAHGQLPLVRLLLARGASLDPKDQEGRTVVQLAVASGMDALIVLVQEAANGVRPQDELGGAFFGSNSASLVSLEDRMRTLGPRIDALPYKDVPLTAPAALPLPKWEGQKFMFLPMERDLPSEAPSFKLGTSRGDGDTRNAPYESLVGRVGTVVRTGKDFVVMKMDDDGVMLRGTPGPNGNLPELAPALDLYLARKLYAGKIVWPKDPLLDRYTRAKGAEAFVRIGAGVPVLVRGVFPGENAANPIRLVLETGDGRQGFLDIALSGTNAPTGGRPVYRFNDMFFAGDPRHSTGWGAVTWSAIRAGRVLPGFSKDQVRAAWGRPDQQDGDTWLYADPAGRVRFAGGNVVEVSRRRAN